MSCVLRSHYIASVRSSSSTSSTHTPTAARPPYGRSCERTSLRPARIIERRRREIERRSARLLLALLLDSRAKYCRRSGTPPAATRTSARARQFVSSALGAIAPRQC
jgi:hypothetical protein